jgi:hypothetical protein
MSHGRAVLERTVLYHPATLVHSDRYLAPSFKRQAKASVLNLAP